MVSQQRRDVLAGIGAGTGLSLVGGIATAEIDGTDDRDDGTSEVPFDDRIADLLERLTIDEKASLLHQYQPPIPSAGLDAFRTGTEALHGVAWLGEATVFPQAIGLGSTWDPDLVERVGDAVGDEVRGKHNATDGGVGLNVWSPTVDPLRDPRWGRNEEGYAEDPLVSGEIATAYTDGLTGDHPTYLKTAPILKHYIGYNNETERTTTNAELPPRLLREYYLPFFRDPIESGTAAGVMASYNLVNGRPMTVSPLLDGVREWAPDGNAIMNVSDAWAPVNLTGDQAYFDSDAEARAAAVLAGLDSFTEFGADNSTTTDALLGAIEDGHLDEADLDRAAGHVLTVRSLLGEFLEPSEDPYADLTEDVIGHEDHRELACEAARKGAVLLENGGDGDDDGVLPLSTDDTVAVVGPLSDRVFEDWYSGAMPYRITLREGLRDRFGPGRLRTDVGADRIALKERSSGDYVSAGVGKGGGVLGLQSTDAPSVQLFERIQWTDDAWTLRATANERYVTVDGDELVNSSDGPGGWEVVDEAFEFVDVGDAVVLYHPGSDSYVTVEEGTLRASADAQANAARFDVEVRTDGIEAAVEAARDADAAVIAVGTHPLMGGRETQDRETLALPHSQRELVERVGDAQTDTAVVLQSSYPVHLEGVEDRVPSILWTSHAGQETGRALTDVLVGDVSPGGRLTQTWPRSADRLPDITEYNIAETGMTYRYGQADPLYAFGHGRSYSSFEYDDLRISPTGPLEPGETATVSVRVTNTGSTAADEVVQLYTRQRQSRTDQPERVLRGFERIHLEPGESVTVEFSIEYDEFSFWDITRRQRVVERATHSVLVGAASDDIRERGSIRVDGETIPPRDLSATTQAVDADDWSWSEIELLDRSRSAGTVVGMTDGSWLSFADVDLRSKPTKATVSVARADEGEATLELRRGSPSGPLLGRTGVPSTGGVYEYAERTLSLEHANGNNRDLYVVVRGGDVRVHTIQLE
ncbi:glycoside hydrolase family 3 C-terminal domain-containing protein (plasmid) [Haloterrigena salifodinae]|uniref:Glycoside hydrolase family 3 C-terminal domain-containing protein n=1 Tax=Haloterrigena salifodinae TaxID=2675099 RepID=A0A8T8E8C3_9EURY|nr:glycoside hydrolase family 3 protein [Haloterrigena salifodinae]QRV17883.1 glycoside hydrolase family 3 C-terminal domain-containing protein [Haloterrigena salifodinae]